jgi:GAF domain-containing protein
MPVTQTLPLEGAAYSAGWCCMIHHTDDDRDEVQYGARARPELQELLLATEDIDHFLHQLTLAACIGVRPDVSAGITVRRDGRPATAASSDSWASRLDEVQYGHRQGPCLSSLATGETIAIEDLAGDSRWPEYRPGALAHGVRSSLSIPLVQDEKPAGVLNLYSRQPRAFGARERHEAERFAAEASRVLALAVRLAQHAELADNLQVALASRATIDQAMGVIMGQNRCTPEEAFAVLRSASQNRNVKLRTIAAEIIDAVSKPSSVPREVE